MMFTQGHYFPEVNKILKKYWNLLLFCDTILYKSENINQFNKILQIFKNLMCQWHDKLTVLLSNYCKVIWLVISGVSCCICIGSCSMCVLMAMSICLHVHNKWNRLHSILLFHRILYQSCWKCLDYYWSFVDL